MDSNQNIKTTSGSNFTQKSIVSGRLKRPTKQLPNLATTSKKPFLKEYSIAMEEKLQNLKQKISEKKKQKTKEQSAIQTQKAVDPKLQKFLKTKVKPLEKNLQQTIKDQLTKQKLHDFLVQVNLLLYKNLLFEHQIDSLQILAEATQKQLEQIGIPKGHALKLKVNISKWSQNRGIQQKQKSLRQTKTKDSERNTSFISIDPTKPIQKEKKQEKPVQKLVAESICIGTQQDGMESIAFISTGKLNQGRRSVSKFCLFCYQSIKKESLVQELPDFCSEDCEQKYGNMFKRYENNLIKAEQDFKQGYKLDKINQEKGSQDNQEQNENNSQEEEYDFLNENNQFYEDFDYQDYEKLKKELEDF